MAAVLQMPLQCGVDDMQLGERIYYGKPGTSSTGSTKSAKHLNKKGVVAKKNEEYWIAAYPLTCLQAPVLGVRSFDGRALKVKMISS